MAIPAITTFELFQASGILTGKEQTMLSEALGKALAIPLEHEAAGVAGIVKSRLRDGGIQLSSEDCLIAGTAITGKDVLLTRNLKDFSRIKDLKVATY